MTAFAVGDPVLYRIRDDYWLPSTIINITAKRIVLRPDGYRGHRNTTLSEIRSVDQVVSHHQMKEGQTHMDAASVNARIDELEKTLGAVVPAIAQGAAMIRLVGSLVRGKMSPDQQKTFDTAMSEYDAQNTNLQGAVDRLRAASQVTSSSSTSSSAPSSTVSHGSHGSTSTSDASSSGPSNG